MKYREIQVDDYLFEIRYSTTNPSEKLALSFKYLAFPKREMTKEELELGQNIQRKEILTGHWDWLIEKSNIKIELPCYDIVITLDTARFDTKSGKTYYNGGSIEHKLTEDCPYCNEKGCNFDCPDALEWASDRDEEVCVRNNKELENKRTCNFALDAIASMILSHAVAGLDVKDPAYIEGIETAVEAIANHI